MSTEHEVKMARLQWQHFAKLYYAWLAMAVGIILVAELVFEKSELLYMALWPAAIAFYYGVRSAYWFSKWGDLKANQVKEELGERRYLW